MKNPMPLAILTLLVTALAIPTLAQDPKLPAAPAPAPPAEPADNEAVPPIAPVPPPVSSPMKLEMKNDAMKSDEGLTDDVTADDFDQALKSLRMELESVRAMRRNRADPGSISVSSAVATVTQRKMLLSLLRQLAERGPQKRETPTNQTTRQTTPEANDDADLQLLIDSGQAIDPFALGRALFRMNEFDRAEKAFRGVTPNGQNETYLNYLIATCLRKQNKIEEAKAIYQKIVLDNDADPILVESAQWQLSNIYWRQKMEFQLKRLREVRQGVAPVDAGDGNGDGNGAAPANGGAAPAALGGV